jgi:hypothetical protein
MCCRGSGSACIARESATRGLETVAEARKCLQGPCECSRGHESTVRVLIKAMRVPIVIVGEPKEAARVYNTLTASTTLSQP